MNDFEKQIFLSCMQGLCSNSETATRTPASLVKKAKQCVEAYRAEQKD